MKRFLKVAILGSLLTWGGYTAFAEVNASATDVNQCVSSANSYGDNNEAMDAQNPLCRVAQSSVTLTNSMLGYQGPFSVATQYSSEYGVVINTKFTQKVRASDAISLELDWGSRENRIGFSWGHAWDEQNRVKLTMERLSQAMNFSFDAGDDREWVAQYAGGAQYQYALNRGIFSTVDVGAYYSRAQSKNLADQTYSVGDSTYLNQRHIAGATSDGISTGLGLEPWSTGVVNLTVNYDRVRYDRKYDTAVNDSSGMGGGVKLTQLLTNTLKADIAASDRKIYNLYEAGLSWLAHATPSTRLELGLSAARTQGHGAVTDNRIQLSGDYSWGFQGSPDPVYTLPRLAQLGDLAGWTAIPAVHLSQVLAIADQRTTLVVPTAPSVQDSIRRLLQTQNSSVDVVVSAGDTTSHDVNLLNYLPVSDPTLITSVVPDTGYLSNIKMTYNPATGHLVGNPPPDGVDTMALTYDITALKQQYGLNELPNSQTTTFNIKAVPQLLQPIAEQSYVQNNPTDMSRNSGSDPDDPHQGSDGAYHIQLGQSATITLDKGYYTTHKPSDITSSLFVYPNTGVKDAKIARIAVPSVIASYVTCLSCGSKDNVNSSTFQIKVNVPSDADDVTSAQPYLVNVYPSNTNGEGAPQAYKLMIDPNGPKIYWNGTLSYANITTQTATVNWPMATNKPSSPITYEVSVDDKSAVVDSVSGTSAQLSHLKAGTQYTVTVTAKDEQGSTPLSKSTPPLVTAKGIDWGNIQLVYSDLTTQSATVTWQRPSDDVVGADVTYIVRVDNDSSVIVDYPEDHQLNARLLNLKSGQVYEVAVIASDDQDSDSAILKTPTLATPQGLTWNGALSFSNKTTTSLVVTWPSAQDDVAGAVMTYHVSVNDQPVADTADLSTTLTGLDIGTSYHVVVSVTDDKGTASPQSLEGDVKTASGFIAWPDGLTFTNIDTQSADVSWQPAVDDIAGAQVGYQVSVNGQDVSRSDPASLTQHLTGLNANQSYRVTVTAYDDQNSPMLMNSDSFTTAKGIVAWDGELTFTDVTQNSATVNWLAAQDDVSRAVITYTVSVDNGASALPVSTTGLTAAITGLQAGQSYHVTVQAKDDQPGGAIPAPKTADLHAGDVIVWTPNVVAQPMTDTHTLHVTWDAATTTVSGGSVSYQLIVDGNQVTDIDVSSRDIVVNHTADGKIFGEGSTHSVVIKAIDGTSPDVSSPAVNATTYAGITFDSSTLSGTAQWSQGAHIIWTPATTHVPGATINYVLKVNGKTVANPNPLGTDVTELAQGSTPTITLDVSDGVSDDTALLHASTSAQLFAGLAWSGNIAATASDTTATLTYPAATDDIPGYGVKYTVLVNGQTPASLGITAVYEQMPDPTKTPLTATLSGLQSGQDYDVTMTASDSDAALPHPKDSSLVTHSTSFTTAALALTVNPVTDFTYQHGTVTWTATTNTGNPLSYTVQLCSDASCTQDYSSHVTYTKNQTTAQLSGLDEIAAGSQTLTVVVTATDGVLTQKQSQSFTTSAIHLGTLTLVKDATTPWDAANATWSSTTVPSNGQTVHYHVQLVQADGAVVVQEMTTDMTSATFTGLAASTAYVVKITAYDGSSESTSIAVPATSQSDPSTTDALPPLVLTINPADTITTNAAHETWISSGAVNPVIYSNLHITTDAAGTQIVSSAVIAYDATNKPTEAQISQLTPGTDYYFWVTVTDTGTGLSVTQHSPVFSTTPTKINLSIDNFSNIVYNGAQANWHIAPNPDSGQPVTYTVKLYSDLNHTTEVPDAVVYADHSQTTAQLTKLTYNSVYYLGVTAHDGVSVDETVYASFTTAAQPVLTVTMGDFTNVKDTTATANWSAQSVPSTGLVVHYAVQLLDKDGNSVAGNHMNYVDDTKTTVDIYGLTAQTQYTVKVTANDGLSVSGTDQKSFTTAKATAINLTIDNFTNIVYNGAQANWHIAPNPDSGQPVTYTVKLYSDAAHTVEVPNAVVYADHSQTTAQLTKLTYNSVYYLGVTAHDGVSADETVYASFTTAAQPVLKVTMGNYTNVKDVSATANWSVASTPTTGLTVHYAVQLLDDNLDPVEGDHFKYSDDTQPTVDLYGLTAQTTYFVKVTATDGVSKPASAQKSFTTTAPNALSLTINAASSITSNSATETWSAGSSLGHAVTYKNIKVTTSSDGSGTPVWTMADGDQTSANITGLSQSTTYYFWVTAVDTVDGSSKVGNSSFTTLTNTLTLNIDAASNVSTTTAHESWSASSSLGHTMSYKDIKVTTSDNSSAQSVGTVSISGTAADISNLSLNTTYYFWVTAVDNVDGSEKTSRSQFTTLSARYSYCPPATAVMSNNQPQTVIDGSVVYKPITSNLSRVDNTLFLFSAGYQANNAKDPNNGQYYFLCSYSTSTADGGIVFEMRSNIPKPSTLDTTYFTTQNGGTVGYMGGIYTCATNSSGTSNQNCGAAKVAM